MSSRKLWRHPPLQSPTRRHDLCPRGGIRCARTCALPWPRSFSAGASRLQARACALLPKDLADPAVALSSLPPPPPRRGPLAAVRHPAAHSPHVKPPRAHPKVSSLNSIGSPASPPPPHKRAQTPKVFCFGSALNPGIRDVCAASGGGLEVGNINSPEDVTAFATKVGAALAIIGPEAPLEAAVVRRCSARRLTANRTKHTIEESPHTVSDGAGRCAVGGSDAVRRADSGAALARAAARGARAARGREPGTRRSRLTAAACCRRWRSLRPAKPSRATCRPDPPPRPVTAQKHNTHAAPRRAAPHARSALAAVSASEA